MMTTSRGMIPLLSALPLLLLNSPSALSADNAAIPAPATAAGEKSADEAGTTIVGDQDAAVGLFLAPWKNETRSGDNRPPGLMDPNLNEDDAASYARAVEHYAAGRAYRSERLMRAR